VSRERRADFLADLYLALQPQPPDPDTGIDFIAEQPRLAPLAAAAAATAAKWDELVAGEATEQTRAARLMSALEAHLAHDPTISQGGFADCMERAGETLRRAAAWPGDAVSTVFAELRPALHTPTSPDRSNPSARRCARCG
jgi:hypothetical protein